MKFGRLDCFVDSHYCDLNYCEENCQNGFLIGYEFCL